jgi:acyl carrier protein
MAHYRRARGQAAVSIDWGLWREVGFIRTLGSRGPATVKGMKSIAPEAGIRVLEHLLASDDVQTVVWPADWEEWAHLYPSFSRTSFIAHLTGPLEAEPERPARTTLRLQLLDAPDDQREFAVKEHVANAIAKQLRLAAADLPRETPLEQLGFDSLVATELQADLQEDLGVRIPVMRLLGFSSVQTIADEVLELFERSSRSQTGRPHMARSETVRVAKEASASEKPLKGAGAA